MVALVASTAAAQNVMPGLPLKHMRFYLQDQSVPRGKQYSYANSTFETDYRSDGSCGFGPMTFLAEKYKYTFSTSCKLATGEMVGALGGVFRAKCYDREAEWERVDDTEVPKGVKMPRWDSLTIPVRGNTGLNRIVIAAPAINVNKEKEPSASLQIEWIEIDKPRKKKNALFSAVIKPGDIVLLHDNMNNRDNGHVVRAIVLPDKETRIVGWVELAPEPIPEMELVRAKKPFVRPQPQKEP